MPTTPRAPANPKDLSSQHPIDRRYHPIEGMVYRVLDAGWKKLYGQNLSWLDAKKLKNTIANRRISTTVMLEAEDLPIPAQFQEAAINARRELFQHESPVTPPAPLVATPPIRTIGGADGTPVVVTGADAPVTASSPMMPPNAQSNPGSIAALQSNAMAAASKAAQEAQARSEAAQRRAEYKRQGEEARKLMEANAAKAGELDGGDDVGDQELSEFLDGAGAVSDA